MRGWFAQFEAIVSAQKKGDQAMYELVLGQLERQDVDEIYDILLRPPENGKYEAIKSRLIEVYEESEQHNVQRVLAGIELGDYKPSQLLRRMQNLAGNNLSDTALRTMWLNQLPAHISSIIAISTTTSINEAAKMADKMMDQRIQREISVVNNSPPLLTTPSTSRAENQNPYAQNMPYKTPKEVSSALANELMLLNANMLSLSKEVMAMKVERNRSQPARGRNWRTGRDGWRSRSRSRSRSRYPKQTFNRQQGDRAALGNQDICYYHRKFGSEANKCTKPCGFDNQAPRSPVN